MRFKTLILSAVCMIMAAGTASAMSTIGRNAGATILGANADGRVRSETREPAIIN